jgi:hypothetical protein
MSFRLTVMLINQDSSTDRYSYTDGDAEGVSCLHRRRKTDAAAGTGSLQAAMGSDGEGGSTCRMSGAGGVVPRSPANCRLDVTSENGQCSRLQLC